MLRQILGIPRATNCAPLVGFVLLFLTIIKLVLLEHLILLQDILMTSPAEKGLTSWLSFVVSTVSLSLSHWYPGSGVGQVWYLIVSIPDLCTLTYFA